LQGVFDQVLLGFAGGGALVCDGHLLAAVAVDTLLSKPVDELKD